MTDLLHDAAERGARYVAGLGSRPVAPTPAMTARLAELDHPLPSDPTEPAEVLRLLDEIGSSATVATAGPRYFGLVTGGSLPAALAANWLAGAWDQNAGLLVSSPIAARLEEVATGWLRELLGLPAETEAGFVTGATMANFCGLAAARHLLLERQGWDVESDGLFGAPPLTVVVGDEVHTSVLKALSLLGLGRDRVVRVPADGQGRLRADRLPPLGPATVVCAQAGNVNTGAFDPLPEICERAREAAAWVHVDGAFGLWAAAAPARAHLTAGIAGADSWATDAHKWLNVPYDSGITFCRHPAALSAAMTLHRAAYLIQGERREPYVYTPEASRRARGIEVWAALRSLGRSGVGALVERTSRLARRFADQLEAAGLEILNEVVLNQVMVSFGTPEQTTRGTAAVQEDGTCWCGGTVWQGRTAMRISVSNWATTEADVDASVAAMLRAAAPIPAGPRRT
jgi:glutamate/tyrosine decarboxylase-like PLP-dependent enzyme